MAMLVPCPECGWKALARVADLAYTTCDERGEITPSGRFLESNLLAPWEYTGTIVPYMTNIREHVEEGHGLLLFGPPGGGKTHIASMIGTAAVMAGIPTRMTTLVALLDKVKAGFGDKSADDVWARYRDQATLLILDDLGSENRNSEWVPERVFDLFDHRIKHKLPMVVTTNYAPDELGKRISARDETQGGKLVSRLQGMCRTILIMPKRDFRELQNRRGW